MVQSIQCAATRGGLVDRAPAQTDGGCGGTNASGSVRPVRVNGGRRWRRRRHVASRPAFLRAHLHMPSGERRGGRGQMLLTRGRPSGLAIATGCSSEEHVGRS